MKKILLIIAISAILSDCKKEKGKPVASPEDIARAKSFDSTIQGKNYQIAKYYSNTPIDYIDTDAAIKSETDLFQYVSLWIKDDLNSFNSSTGKVTIQQGADKFPGDNSATIIADYKIGADANGVYFDFLNYQYQPLPYRLITLTDSSFIVSAELRKGINVITEFRVKN